jgi:hypothetical protein
MTLFPATPIEEAGGMQVAAGSAQRPQAGLITRLLLKLAAVDEETLRTCPQHDHENARAVAYIVLFNWLYLAALWSLIGHRLFSLDGRLRPEIVLVSGFLAAFIVMIDSYIFIRSGWHLNGLHELKRAGIDISGGWKMRIKNALFFPVRILLGLGNSQLSAVFFALIIFGADVDTRIHEQFIHANAGLAEHISVQVDTATQQAAAAVAYQAARASSLSAEVEALRQNSIDPSDHRMKLAEQELAQIIQRKTKADDDLREAEAYAAAEAGGRKGEGHSGQAGFKVKYRAAMEEVKFARDRAAALARELGAARTRLDDLRKEPPSSTAAVKQQARDQLPGFEQKLNAENEKLALLRSELAALTANREATIRKRIEASQDYVPVAMGLIAQITVLHDLAHDNAAIWWVIVLVEVVAFGFEMAMALVKMISYVPTSYTARLARDTYVGIVRIADEMMAEIDRSVPKMEPAAVLNPIPDAVESTSNGEAFSPDVFGDKSNLGQDHPPKRRRGRPRKNPPPFGDTAVVTS